MTQRIETVRFGKRVLISGITYVVPGDIPRMYGWNGPGVKFPLRDLEGNERWDVAKYGDMVDVIER